VSTDPIGRSPWEGHDLCGRALDGRYRLLRRLGAGGMGTVYLAEHVALGSEVAVKVLRSDLAATDRHRKRFLREARAASRIKNDRVVSITDFGMTGDGIVYFVMEHIGGENLEALLRREGARRWADAKPIIVQIASGVAAAHAEGIIHRDIKPSNCMVYDDGTGGLAVKVLDFGLAKLTSGGADLGSLDVTSTDELFGTVAYMAPELTQGKKADHRTDIYAVGVLLHRMLSGELPFRGETAFQVLTHHVNTPPPLLRDIAPAEVEACVLRAMAKDPMQRFASVEEMRAVLAAIPDGAAPTTQVVLGRAVAGDEPTESLRVRAQQSETEAVPSAMLPKRAGGHRTIGIAIAAGIGATALAAWAIHASREPREVVAEAPAIAKPVPAHSERAPAEERPEPVAPIPAATPPATVEAAPPQLPPPATAAAPPVRERAAKPSRPPRPRESTARPPTDGSVASKLADAIASRCRGAGPAGHVTIRCAVGSDGRVLSATASGGNEQQRACAKALAKGRTFKAGATRVVKAEADL
jgi:serine/threonine-protein kinase